MNIKTTIPISEARKKIFKIAKDVQHPDRHYTLTEKGRPMAVIISVQEFDSWQETLEVTKDFPSLEKDIKIAEKEYKKGDYATLEDFMKREGFIFSDSNKGKIKHGISSSHTKKGSKGNR